ncbi:MAG: FliI/YscN family ATPase [Planctomycetota bacterium]
MSLPELPDSTRLRHAIRELPLITCRGVVEEVIGITIKGIGIPAAVGELCDIERPGGGTLAAEVIGFAGDRTVLMPFGPMHGIRPGAVVRPRFSPLRITVGDFLLGRVLDGFGRPLDDGPPIPAAASRVSIERDAPRPLERQSISKVFETQISAIDGLLTCGRGQRVGIFAGSGVGKSTLLGQIARQATADVAVIALVGERGREVGDFIHESLGVEGLKRSVLVVATSDRSPLERFKACFVATAVAEYFRDSGKDVLLMMDSVTRLAMASREIGLALGEPPTSRGYPPSFFAMLPRLFERLGNTSHGSITGLFTVLVEGDDTEEPVSDTVRSLLDGHLVLSRELAQRQVFPAIDVLQSVSRTMGQVVPPEHVHSAAVLRELLALYKSNEDLVRIGMYQRGTDPLVDRAIDQRDDLLTFVRQAPHEARSFEDTLTALHHLARRGQG